MTSPLLKVRGSFYKRRTSATENINGSIYVTIMNRSAITTLPFSYSKTCDTFRPLGRQGAAARTGLGGKSFIDFLEHSAMPNGLVRELVAECRPACIIDGLCHAGLGESCRIDVANGDVVELVHDAMREFVNEVAAAGGDLCVNLLGLTLLTGPLSLSEEIFECSIVARVVDLLAGGKRSEIFEPKIYSDTRSDGARKIFFDLNGNVQIPVAKRVPRETCTVFDLSFWKWPRLEHSENISIKSEIIANPVKVTAFYREPAKRLFATISQIWATLFYPRFCILLTYCVDCPSMQTKFFTASRGKSIQIKTREPFSVKAKGILLPIIAVVPDKINLPGLLV